MHVTLKDFEPANKCVAEKYIVEWQNDISKGRQSDKMLISIRLLLVRCTGRVYRGEFNKLIISSTRLLYSHLMVVGLLAIYRSAARYVRSKQPCRNV